MKRVSELITIDKAEKWENGDIVFIAAGTGRGKSYFIKNNLKYISGKKDKNILLLTNRGILKDQFIQELKMVDKKGTIEIVNYQFLENKILYKNDISDFDKHDYIVADEAHYFYEDANFNKNTDLSLNWILEQKNKVRIFMSATMDVLINYITKYKKMEALPTYEIKNDYSFIDNLYFYRNNNTIDSIIDKIPEDEKVIYFASAKKAYELSKKVSDSAFYCSEHNKRYKKYRDLVTHKQIVENCRFEKKLLCTTTVLDNGISIKDELVKHIIIDVLNIETIIQCIGRKRIKNKNDKINIYIRNYPRSEIIGYMNTLENKIKYAKIFESEGIEGLDKKYPRENWTSGGILYYDVDDSSWKINEMANFKIGIAIAECQFYTDKRFTPQYTYKIEDKLGRRGEQFDGKSKTESITEYLNSLVGKKLYNELQKDLINIIDLRVNGRRQRSYSKLNEYLKILELPYVISPKKSNSSRYWIIEKNDM